MRAVVDTNVFIGACLGSMRCANVLRACFLNRVQPLMGTALLTEFEAVLSREVLFQTSRLNADERDELLDAFLARCEWVRIYYGWRPNLPDEGDNHLVELAVAGGAQVIVTCNVRDLGRADLVFPALKTLTPDQFLTQMP